MLEQLFRVDLVIVFEDVAVLLYDGCHRELRGGNKSTRCAVYLLYSKELSALFRCGEVGIGEDGDTYQMMYMK